jgi:hypothetical protein
MYKTISNEIIRQFKPCYDPSKVIKDENEELPIKDWVEKYRNVVPAKDIIWLLSRKEFLSEKYLILFAVWCARESLKLIENPDERSVEACNVAERYANGEATKEELLAARDAALNAAQDVDRYVYHDAFYAAFDAAYAAYYTSKAAADAAYYTSKAAYFASKVAYGAYDDAYDAYDAARSAQLDKLLTYF